MVPICVAIYVHRIFEKTVVYTFIISICLLTIR